MKIGIIREEKNPPDRRVPLSPEQCRDIVKKNNIDLYVQTSANRCFEDEEYKSLGLKVVDDVSHCDILLGVKEVPINSLINDKTYFFFSHTIKAQAYNRDLLKSILRQNIKLIDWETLTNDSGQRLIAFGRFAGMVGAHNALWTYGRRTGHFDLKRMVDCKDYAEAKAMYANLDLPPVKIVLTGSGRVANGSAEVLKDMGIAEVSADDFISNNYDHPVYTQLSVQEYVKRKDNQPFTNEDFYNNPSLFEDNFAPYTQQSDIFINGIYWDNEAPAFFTVNDMKEPSFRIKVIADVTCDIAPVSSVPSTLRPSTIDDPVYGFDPSQNTEVSPYQDHVVDIMAIDNLPNELPRDASTSFGEQFIEFILPELLRHGQSSVISRATITDKGRLTEGYTYLQDFVNE